MEQRIKKILATYGIDTNLGAGFNRGMACRNMSELADYTVCDVYIAFDESKLYVRLEFEMMVHVVDPLNCDAEDRMLMHCNLDFR